MYYSQLFGEKMIGICGLKSLGSQHVHVSHVYAFIGRPSTFSMSTWLT